MIMGAGFRQPCTVVIHIPERLERMRAYAPVQRTDRRGLEKQYSYGDAFGSRTSLRPRNRAPTRSSKSQIHVLETNVTLTSPGPAMDTDPFRGQMGNREISKKSYFAQVQNFTRLHTIVEYNMKELAQTSSRKQRGQGGLLKQNTNGLKQNTNGLLSTWYNIPANFLYFEGSQLA